MNLLDFVESQRDVSSVPKYIPVVPFSFTEENIRFRNSKLCISRKVDSIIMVNACDV